MLYTVKYTDAVRQEGFKYVASADKLHPGCPLVRIASTNLGATVLSFEDVRDLAVFANNGIDHGNLLGPRRTQPHRTILRIGHLSPG